MERAIVAGTVILGATLASTFSWAEAVTAQSAFGSTSRYSAVTDERLLDPEPENWLSYRRTYDGWGYSPLDQIDTGNVADLAPAWSFSTGVTEGHEAPPIVNDGVMFITTPGNRVFALDARTGDLMWRYVRELPEDLAQFHPTNRGVALFGDRVFMATLDAHVVALDAASGEVVWETEVENYRNGYYMTLAPLAARGKVMVGVSGGELGIRGFVVALDSETGEQAWKSYTVPAPGEPGNDTWPGDTWRTGGAAVWLTGHYRSRVGAHVLGHGKPRPVDGRCPSRRQPLHELGHRPGCRHGGDESPPPVPLERLLGLGRGVHSAAHRRRA